MTVEIFTKEQFETALPVHKTTGAPLWSCMGFVRGEWQYLIHIDAETGIIVRSSVERNGQSSDTGQGSIRAWLVRYWGEFLPGQEMAEWGEQPLGSKIVRWTTRQPGWAQRLDLVIRQLWKLRTIAGNCEHCGDPKRINKVKKPGTNQGRLFATCNQQACDVFMWLEITDEKMAVMEQQSKERFEVKK